MAIFNSKLLVYQRVYGFTMSYRLRTDDVTMKTGDLRIHTLIVVIDEGTMEISEPTVCQQWVKPGKLGKEKQTFRSMGKAWKPYFWQQKVIFNTDNITREQSVLVIGNCIGDLT